MPVPYDRHALFAKCYTSTGGAQDLDDSVLIDCLNADAAGPCGSVISSVAEFVKWQSMHMRQAVRACAPSSGNAPFFTGPRDQIECPAGTPNGPILTQEHPVPPPPTAPNGSRGRSYDRAASVATGPYLLEDSVWKEYIHANTIFPDWNAFGTYTLGLWWEQLYPEPNMWCLHHAGDLPGMASKEVGSCFFCWCQPVCVQGVVAHLCSYHIITTLTPLAATTQSVA